VKFAVMFVIIAGLVGFLVSEELTGNPNMGIGKTFSLPEMAWRGTSGAGSSPDSNVSCDIKSTLYVVDDKGKNIKTVQSSMLTGTPLDIVNPSDDRPVSIFLVIPKIYCTTDNENITVKESNLNLSIYGEKLSINESKKQPLNLSYKKTGGLGETALSWFSITDKTIENELSKSSTFTSNIRFDITGNVEIIYDNEPNNKMTIPINQGDIMTKWYYKSIASVTPESLDKDGDGIRDDNDDCVNSKETFNGYNDDDGCPDSVPNTPKSTPVTPVTPVDKNSCNADSKTWYVTNTGNGLCAKKFITQDGDFCKEYDVSVGVNSCVDPKQVSNDIPAKVKFQVDISMAGGASPQAYNVQDDPSPFDVSIPLSLLGNNEITGQTGSFNIEPRLVIDDSKIHGLTDTKVSNLKIETFVKVKDNEYSLGKDNVNGFLPKNGGSISDSETGFPLGSIDVSSFDIQNVIPSTIVPLGTDERVDLRFVVSGGIEIVVNDGKYKNIGLDLTGADFEINNLKIVRGEPQPTPTPTPYRSPTECEVDETEQVVGDETECVPNTVNTPPEELSCKNNEEVVIVSGIPECALKTGNIDNPQCQDGTDECVVTTGGTITSGGETTTSGGSGGVNLTPNDESSTYLLYGVIGVLVLGFIAFLIKRRN
jgi:hypothetical protein